MRVRHALLGAVTGLAMAFLGTAPAWASNEMLVQEPFNGSTMASPNWFTPSAPGHTNVACLTAGTSTTQTPVAGCGLGTPDPSGSGALRLTPDTGNEEGGVAYGLSVPTTDGIDATFDTYQYGSHSGYATGADGIAFFLAAANPADPQPPSAIGSAGGDLGYSALGTTSPGMTYGYLGIGFDVYGNYTNPSFEGTGCTDPGWDTGAFADNVSVRGPGNGTVGYCMLNSTKSTGGLPSGSTLDGGTSGTRTSSQVPVEVVINPSTSSVTTASGLSVPAGYYEVAFTPIGGTQQILSGALPDASSYLPSGWANANGVPYQLTFGWVGSTGGDEEFHEVNEVQSATASGTPPILTSSVTDNAGGAPASGSTVDYDVNIANQTGTSTDSSPITVTDTLPTGETASSTGLGGTGWSCTNSGQTVTCTNDGPLASGASLPSLTIPATVTASAGTTLTNSLVASSDDSDPTSGRETVTVATPPTDTSTCGTANGSAGWFVTDPTCTVQGTDSDPSIDHVAYQLDGAGAVTTNSGTTTATVPITTDGTHTLKTEVFNTSGQGSGWTTHTLDVDTTPPTDTSTCGTPNGQNGYFVSDPTCTVQGADSISGVDHVAYQLDGGSVVTTNSGTTTAGVPITTDGTHTLKTEIFNAAGLNSGWQTQTIQVLTAAPAAPSVTSPAAGAVSNLTSPIVTVTGVPGDIVTVQIDGIDYGPVTLDGSGHGQVQVTGPLSPGQHTVRAQQVDAAGNASAWSTTSTWTVKTSTTAQLTGPTGGPTNDTTPTIDYSGEVGDQFTITVDSQVVATGVITGSGAGSLTLPTALANGAHTIEIIDTDAAGNQASETIVVTVDTVAPGIPQIVTAPAQVTSNQNATFTFADAKSPVTYKCALDGGVWSACPTPVTFSSVADGPHTLLVEAVDQAGNVSPSAEYGWTVETAAPPAPTILGGPSRYSVPSPTSFEISAQPGTTLECSLDGAAYQACSTLVSLNTLAIGSHSLVAREIDEAGNVSAPADYEWTVLGATGAAGLPRTASLAVARQSSAYGNQALDVGCNLNAGSVKRCSVTAFYHGIRVGRGVTSVARAGHSRTIVRIALTATGRRLLTRALGGLPIHLVGRVTPFAFPTLAPSADTVLYAPLRFVLQDVLFQENRWTLTPNGRRIVHEIARELKGARAVECEGNTDSLGGASYNQWLGLQRAQVVCHALRALGVRASMSTISYAATRPVASNATPAGRHLNRRVVLRVTYYDLPHGARSARR